MHIYYIDPVKANAERPIEDLLDALADHFPLDYCLVMQVTTPDDKLDAVLSELASYSRLVMPAPAPEPAPVSANGNGHKPEPAKACPDCGKPNRTGRRCRACAAKAKAKLAAKKPATRITIYTIVGTGEQITSRELARRLREREFEIGTRLTSTREPGELVVVAGVRGHELHNLATQAGVEV